MIKYIIYFCFSFIFLSSLHGQTVIKGQCKTKSGNTIDFASIVLSDSSGEVLAYTTTDSSGNFSLTFNSKWDSLVLSFSHMNYEDAHKKVLNQSQTISFSQIIERKDKVLQEVFAQSAPITDKGDSINYLAEKFITQRDKTLEDILKKMPGIDVDASGRIKFQGVSINKFYVENKDLMGGDYDMISKSMPVGDVRMVQVLPRHQPIGILKDRIPSPYPAINIKLKRKVSLTGRATIGAGFSPFLHELSITPMLFSKKNQMLIDVKSNNIGNNLNSAFDNEIYVSQFEGIIESSKPTKLVNTTEPNIPLLTENRYLNNNDQSISLNYLIGLNKNWEAKINTSATRINATKIGQSNTTLSIPGNSTVNFERITTTKPEAHQLKTLLTLTNNSDKLFIKNILLFQAEKEKINSHLLLNNNPIDQNLRTPSHNIQNSFSSILPVGKNKKYLLNLMSSISKNNYDQLYNVYPTKFLDFSDTVLMKYDSLKQFINADNFTLTHSAFIGIGLGKFTFMPRIKSIISWDKLQSNLLNHQQEAIKPIEWFNNISYKNNTLTAGINVAYKNANFEMNSFLPISNQTTDLKNNNDSYKENKIVFEPNLLLSIKSITNITMSLHADRKLNYPSISSLHNNYILSALDIYKNSIWLSPSINSSLSPSIEYKHPLINLFSNFNYSYNQTKLFQILNFNTNTNGQNKYDYIDKENTSKAQSISFNISKYFTKNYTSVGLTYTYTTSKNKLLFALKEIDNKNTSQVFNFNTNAALSKLFNIEHKSIFAFQNSMNTGFTIHSNFYTQHTAIILMPSERHLFRIVYDYQSKKSKNFDFSAHLFDIAYQFTLNIKRKIDWELKLNNIFNQKKIEEIGTSYYSIYSNSFYLRPRQIFISIKTNIQK